MSDFLVVEEVSVLSGDVSRSVGLLGDVGGAGDCGREDVELTDRGLDGEGDGDLFLAGLRPSEEDDLVLLDGLSSAYPPDRFVVYTFSNQYPSCNGIPLALPSYGDAFGRLRSDSRYLS